MDVEKAQTIPLLVFWHYETFSHFPFFRKCFDVYKLTPSIFLTLCNIMDVTKSQRVPRSSAPGASSDPLRVFRVLWKIKLDALSSFCHFQVLGGPPTHDVPGLLKILSDIHKRWTSSIHYKRLFLDKFSEL